MYSVPALEGWFSWSIRRNRKSFILAILGVAAVVIVSLFVIEWFSKTASGGKLYFWAFFAPAVICTYFLTAQRLRDMNVSGWLALLWIPIGYANAMTGHTLTPIVLFLLSVIPGTKGSNRYGADPLENPMIFD